MKKLRIVVVGDDTLGDKSCEIASAIIPNVTLIKFVKGTPGARQRSLHQLRELRGADAILVSNYNDLILPGDVLRGYGANANIHPAGPEVGGCGYDVVPVLRNDHIYGATAHVMDEQIDHGPIFRVIKRKRGNWNYAQQRRANQAACLSLFRKVVDDIKRAGGPGSFNELMLEEARKLDCHWGHYFNLAEVKALLEQTYRINPNHPVFEGNTKFLATLQPVHA